MRRTEIGLLKIWKIYPRGTLKPCQTPNMKIPKSLISRPFPIARWKTKADERYSLEASCEDPDCMQVSL